MQSLLQQWRRRRWRPDPRALAAYEDLVPMVVVTGASEGIGHAVARRFAEAGSGVILVARRPGPLQQAAEGIRNDFGVEATVVPVDVTHAGAIPAIEAALAARRAYADVLVNCAGLGLAGPFHDQPQEAIARLLDVNVRALTMLTRHFLTGMRVRGRGGILNIVSLGAYTPGPNQAVYYASKAYLLSLSEAIASELAGEGVRITAVAPGPVNTRFHERMGAEQSLYRYLMVPSSPEAVARAAYYGFALGLRVVIPGPFNPILALALRLLPHRILTPLIGVLLKQRGTSASNARGHSSR